MLLSASTSVFFGEELDRIVTCVPVLDRVLLEAAIVLYYPNGRGGLSGGAGASIAGVMIYICGSRQRFSTCSTCDDGGGLFHHRRRRGGGGG